MTVLGGQLDGIGAVDGVQPLREVGEDSLDRVGGEPANVPDAAVCDGVTQVARGEVGPLFEGIVIVDPSGTYDLGTDGGWDALVGELDRVGELPLNRDRRVMSDEQSGELLKGLRWLDSEEAAA